LHGVDLEVRLGELLMLVGPSGCGKTTLISVLAGVLRRDGGECSVLGRDYNQMAREETTRFRGKNIGFVFQAFDLIPALTPAENEAFRAFKKIYLEILPVGFARRSEARPSNKRQAISLCYSFPSRPIREIDKSHSFKSCHVIKLMFYKLPGSKNLRLQSGWSYEIRQP
jgi:ABC-type sugar transport system ATPase subunit